MNPRFIQSCHIPLKYDLKQGTKGSYYQKSGERGILPERISWGMYAKCKDSNRDSQKVNEINATYKKAEAGLYKGLNQGDIFILQYGRGFLNILNFMGMESLMKGMIYLIC